MELEIARHLSEFKMSLHSDVYPGDIHWVVPSGYYPPDKNLPDLVRAAASIFLLSSTSYNSMDFIRL